MFIMFMFNEYICVSIINLFTYSTKYNKILLGILGALLYITCIIALFMSIFFMNYIDIISIIIQNKSINI